MNTVAPSSAKYDLDIALCYLYSGILGILWSVSQIWVLWLHSCSVWVFANTADSFNGFFFVGSFATALTFFVVMVMHSNRNSFAILVPLVFCAFQCDKDVGGGLVLLWVVADLMAGAACIGRLWLTQWDMTTPFLTFAVKISASNLALKFVASAYTSYHKVIGNIDRFEHSSSYGADLWRSDILPKLFGLFLLGTALNVAWLFALRTLLAKSVVISKPSSGGC